MKQGSFLLSQRPSLAAGLVIAGLMFSGALGQAQVVTGSSQTTTDAQGKTQESATISADLHKKKPRVAKEDQVKQSKDTKAAIKLENKLNPIAASDAQLPDKQLYDKALAQAKSGHYDVARLDLQTLLNAYPDSQYQMRAKLEVANCWYQEGGSAALAQAEQEYTDFITFFPNAPEAAEAQMRVGDIYFKQMDVPDRDSTKAVKAEEAYRTMLKRYPDAPPALLKEGTQKLREVQEVQATRESMDGVFYASHENWAASIARFQTVVDTYPQYSHMDDALIGVGDGYAAEAHAMRAQPVCVAGLNPAIQCLPEAVKGRMLALYDGKAADAYRTVVLMHGAAPHVEDAKERLAAMNLPIPTPTKEQLAASEALEGSRAQYTMTKRLELLFLRKPDTVTAATAGDPPLDDPAATTAPTILNQLLADYRDAYDPKAAAAERAAAKPATSDAAGGSGATPTPAAPIVNAPLSFQDVPAAGGSTGDGSTSTMQEAAPSSGSGTGLGVEVLPSTGSTVPASTLPAATGAPDPNNGLTTVGPKNTAPLPAEETVAPAPDQVNEVSGQKQPAVQPGAAPVNDKNDDSSSKHKPKTGLDKLNPF